MLLLFNETDTIVSIIYIFISDSLRPSEPASRYGQHLCDVCIVTSFVYFFSSMCLFLDYEDLKIRMNKLEKKAEEANGTATEA